MKNYKFLVLLGLVMSLVACTGSEGNTSIDGSASNTSQSSGGGDTSSSSSISSNEGAYYANISSSADSATLLSQLRTLNSQKRKRTIGYDNFGSYYGRTDGDPAKPGNFICYYSGTSTKFPGNFQGAINREHVWPKSRGGNLVDNDIHMTRPSLSADNSSRGNSFFVEGMNHSANGWDPASGSNLARYRGDAARIIFYCVVASSSLKLVDSTNDSTGNKSMGKLSDLLKWHLAYPVADTEIQRNEAIADSSIQGNRNPFIDHPEYACQIWGNTNAATKTVCGL